MKALITGISGFAGSYLAEFLLRKKLEVAGTVLNKAEFSSSYKNQIKILEGNLLDASFIHHAIKNIKPDLIFHLASFTSPAESFSIPYETITNNIGITVNLLEALKTTNAKVLIIGSADEYGIVKSDENPVREDNPLRPTNPYAVSKIAQDFLGLQYYLSNKMNIVRVRPGNHIGPGQRPDFVVSAFARQIALVEAGKQNPVIKVGNLESERDFTDVRDIVRAYLLAVLKGSSGDVYNVGSGKSVKISKILESLIKLSTSKLKVEQDSSRKRIIDVPKIVLDYSKFNKISKWKPEIKLNQSLQDILDYWRKHV